MEMILKEACDLVVNNYRKLKDSLRYDGDLLNHFGSLVISNKSTDESILKITKSNSSSCEYRGVRPGTAEITVRVSKPRFLFVPNNIYLHCSVTVSPRAVSIKFTKNKYRVQPGTKKKLKLTTRPSISKEKATFESSDTEIVEIDTNGRIYAKSIGTVTITAKISNGKTAKCKVIVRNKTAQ